jgi:hypothetical protein
MGLCRLGIHRTLIPPEKVTSALSELQKRNRSANTQNWLKIACEETKLDHESTFCAPQRQSGLWKRKLLFNRKTGVFNVLWNPYFGVDETGTWQAWVVVEGIVSNVVTWETRCYRVHRSR